MEAPAITGPCDTLFTGCYDTLSTTRRSPVVVAGSAVAIDLSKITLSGGNIDIKVSPVMYDAGGDGLDWFVVGRPERTYTRPWPPSGRTPSSIFPGTSTSPASSKGIPLTIAAGDDIFLYGDLIGPDKTEVDANTLPVTLGLVAQDRVYIHESSSRDLTIRAAILAENDEIVYERRAFRLEIRLRLQAGDLRPRQRAGEGDTPWFRNTSPTISSGTTAAWPSPDSAASPKRNAVRTAPAPTPSWTSTVSRCWPSQHRRRPWKFTFEGSLITRNAGSKGPKNDCGQGWDCNSDPGRVTWSYDDNLGVAYPPKFPAPIVDDRNPTQIVGYKRKSF